jgi:hypothetical protein
LYIQGEELFILNKIVDLETGWRVLVYRRFAGNTSNDERSHKLLESRERIESRGMLRRRNKREPFIY